MPTNRQIVLASRPIGEPTPKNFRLVEGEAPRQPEGGVLLRTLYLSLDPYMRGRMSDAPSYAAPTAIGAVMPGGTVSEVLASAHQRFKPGDVVVGYTGWQEYAASDGAGLRKPDPSVAPISTALGVLGMPGMTAYTGLLNIGKPKPGETLVVAAASGAVGSAVGQMAKLKGCRVVGIAGGQDKVRYIVDELGFDAGIDHPRPLTLPNNCGRPVPQWHRHLFRECRRQGLGSGVSLAQLLFPHSHLRTHRARPCASLPTGPDQSPALMRSILLETPDACGASSSPISTIKPASSSAKPVPG